MFLFLVGALWSSSVFGNILGLEDGDACTALGGGPGTCRLLSQCQTAGDFKMNRPPICRFNSKEVEPIICCSDKEEHNLKSGQKAREVCITLGITCKKIYDPKETIVLDVFKPKKKGIGGQSPSDAVGGTEVAPRGHPYMTLIGFCGDEKNDCDIREVMWGCGGSLISPRFVLSAAHCASPQGLGPARWARLGDLDISTSADDAKPVDKRIVELLVYPKYSPAQVYHDIALLKLDSDVEFNGYVLPVCLHSDNFLQETKATFTGWGRTGFVEATSEKLLEAEIDIYNDTECRRLMFSGNSTKTPLGLQPDLMLCAGVPDGSKDACSGDSGGPLIIGNGCYKTQIGITSFGNNCGLPDSPGVYTRVSNYIPWIEKIAFKDVLNFY